MDLPTIRVTEALTHRSVEEMLRGELKARFGGDETWVWVRDVADDWVVFEVESDQGYELFKLDYSVDETAMKATLADNEPTKVVVTSEYAEVSEAEARIRGGRVLEAKGAAVDGGRVFRVRVVEAAVSRNGVNYPQSVLDAAAPLYEGAKAFDHHRTPAELATSTVQGLVGHYRNVEAADGGIDADLFLLPSATHIAEALDATLEAQAAGLPPVVGISHDVAGQFKPAVLGDGRRIREAVAITQVLSADVVADPSAGGRVTRMVAGGFGTDPTPTPSEEETMERLKELSKKLMEGTITDEERTELNGLLSSGEGAPTEPAAPPVTPAPAAVTEPAMAGSVTEAIFARSSTMGRMLVREALEQRNLDVGLADGVLKSLPERFTESAVVQLIELTRNLTRGIDIRTLESKVPSLKVGDEALDTARKRLDATFEGRAIEGVKPFTSFRTMYAAFNPDNADADFLQSTDFGYAVLREAYLGGTREGVRVTEAISAGTFGEALGDSIRRKMIQEYSLPALQAWRRVVSNIESVPDFRTNRRVRIGGYGTLAAVAENGAYAAVTSPTDEEATYAATKRGGLETLSFEAIKNDDIRTLRQIPIKLGRAAAETLYRFVFVTLIQANPTCTYDSVALFAAGHGNTGTAPLTQANLAATRALMRKQAAYNNTSEILDLAPKILLVPAELEETAFKLCNSAVAVVSGTAGSEDATTPNINAAQNLEYIVMSRYTDVNDWFAIADPALVPTIELGFLDGQQDPELFVQDMGNVGAMFSNDQMVYKIRHIYSGAILDHRGFYRHVVP